MSLTVDELIADLRSGDRKVRAKSVKALGRTGNRDAYDAICKLLDDEADGNVKSLGLKALGKLGYSDAVPVLLDHFDSAQPVVVAALIRLGVFDDVLPKSSRERRLVKRALLFATPELKDLVKQHQLTPETLRSVLPPII
jgi:HEAT repeat protein